jgi:hypothetical protein
MVSVTLSVSDDFKSELESFSWVNWSGIAREEAMKKVILEEYLKTRKVTDQQWAFCESIDWHPVDELPMKKSFARKVSAAMRETPIKIDDVHAFFDDIRASNAAKMRKKHQKGVLKESRALKGN